MADSDDLKDQLDAIQAKKYQGGIGNLPASAFNADALANVKRLGNPNVPMPTPIYQPAGAAVPTNNVDMGSSSPYLLGHPPAPEPDDNLPKLDTFPKLNKTINQNTPLSLNDSDSAKVVAGLNTDPNANLKQFMQNIQNNVGKATEIAQRPVWQSTSPEEQAFVEKNLDPISRSVVGGGVMGSIAPVAEEGAVAAKALMPKVINAVGHVADIADEAAPAVKNSFNKLKNLWTSNGIPLGPDTNSAAQALTSQQNIPSVPFGKTLQQITQQPPGYGKITIK